MCCMAGGGPGWGGATCTAAADRAERVVGMLLPLHTSFALALVTCALGGTRRREREGVQGGNLETVLPLQSKELREGG